jgi:predicted small secreted protein
MRRASTITLFVLAFSTLLAGCASHRGIVPVGNDRFVLVKHEVASYPGQFTFRTEIVAEAMQHCAKSGKELNIVGATELPAPNIVVNYRWARIEFECVPKRENPKPGAPRSSQPTRNVA